MSKARRPGKVMVVTAGSGGHVLPAIAFCQQVLREVPQDADLVFVASRAQGAEEMLPSCVKTVILPSRRSLGGVLRLCFTAIRLLWRERPRIVLGFGGYVSIPFMMTARLMGARVMIHEQNAVPGRANRFLSFWAHRVIISFKESARAFGRNNKNVVLARYPLREDLLPVERAEAMKFFGLLEDRFTILVVGGSQGARRINRDFVSALEAGVPVDRLQVIHIAGARDAAFLSQSYRTMNVKSKVFAFLPQMHYAYSAADLVIGRAGAGCVNEIIRFGLPSILVPYPYAGAHQKENARVLARKGAALLLEEERLTPDVLKGLLNIFLDDRIRRKTMSVLARSLYEDAPGTSLREAVWL